MNPFDHEQTPRQGHDPQPRAPEVRGPYRLGGPRAPDEGDAQAAPVNGRRDFSLPAADELDMLAELFLGPGEDDQSRRAVRNARWEGQAAQPGTKPVRIEGLVLGHLPVFAAAWASQYARQRAEALRAGVGTVRLASGTVSVETFGMDGEDAPEMSGWDEAISRLRAAGLVLVRVDEPAEADLAAAPSLDALRVLSGTDDAAVVACYRRLKGLAAAAEEAGSPLPPVALAMMGAERAKALDSHARIARAARAFLDAELGEPVVIERIEPTGARAIFRGRAELSPGEVVRALRDAVEPGESAREARADEPPTRRRSDARVPAPGAGESQGTGWLSGLVAGLRTLESRCPVADRVELAADAQGRLHLVAAQLAAHPEASSVGAVRDLVAAAAWAKSHGELLRRAEPSLRGAGEVSLHLVTDRREDARSLLGTAVRVHLAGAAHAGPMGLMTVSLDD
ncbi:MAG TPA: hypothetical protein VFF69_13515 [Phycisphaerales bacterium]|nr:hypothetical protein [Phycisphaerales bacterium]